MEKLNNLLPKGLLLSYLVKMLIITASFSDMGITIALSGIVALQIYLEKNKKIQEIKEETFKKIDEQNGVIAKQNQLLEQFAIEFTKTKNEIAGVKLRSDFKAAEGFNKPRAI